jgi:hypothetical protein
MLEVSKELVKSQNEEQKNILDTILDGAQKAAQVVQNIKTISSGSDPKPVEPLYHPQQEEKEDTMVTPPKMPSFLQKPQAPRTDPVIAIFEAIAKVRSKVDALFEIEVIGKADAHEIAKDLYDLHMLAYQNMEKK